MAAVVLKLSVDVHFQSLHHYGTHGHLTSNHLLDEYDLNQLRTEPWISNREPAREASD